MVWRSDSLLLFKHQQWKQTMLYNCINMLCICDRELHCTCKHMWRLDDSYFQANLRKNDLFIFCKRRENGISLPNYAGIIRHDIARLFSPFIHALDRKIGTMQTEVLNYFMYESIFMKIVTYLCVDCVLIWNAVCLHYIHLYSRYILYKIHARTINNKLL